MPIAKVNEAIRRIRFYNVVTFFLSFEATQLNVFGSTELLGNEEVCESDLKTIESHFL